MMIIGSIASQNDEEGTSLSHIWCSCCFKPQGYVITLIVIALFHCVKACPIVPFTNLQ